MTTKRYGPYRFVVRWSDNGTIHYRQFKQDSEACAFLNLLLDDGFDAAVIMEEIGNV